MSSAADIERAARHRGYGSWLLLVLLLFIGGHAAAVIGIAHTAERMFASITVGGRAATCTGCVALPRGSTVVLGDQVVATLIASGRPTARGADRTQRLFLAAFARDAGPALIADSTWVAELDTSASRQPPIALRLVRRVPEHHARQIGTLLFTATVAPAVAIYEAAAANQ
jgi:hypothetical protein